MRLVKAKVMLRDSVYAGRGNWIERRFDPKNTKLSVPAEFVDKRFMQHNQLCLPARPKTMQNLEALYLVMQGHVRRELPVIAYFFKALGDPFE